MQAPRDGLRLYASAYALAVLSVAAALIVTLWIDPAEPIVSLFFLAIIVSAWFGGIGPGLSAAVLATLAVDYFILNSVHREWWTSTHAPRLFTFFVSAVVVSSWSALRRRSETQLRQAHEELETRVEERTAELR